MAFPQYDRLLREYIDETRQIYLAQQGFVGTLEWLDVFNKYSVDELVTAVRDVTLPETMAMLNSDSPPAPGDYANLLTPVDEKEDWRWGAYLGVALSIKPSPKHNYGYTGSAANSNGGKGYRVGQHKKERPGTDTGTSLVGIFTM